MLKIVVGALGLLAVFLAPATAADIGRGISPAPYVTAPYGYNWSGPYLGANLGYQWGTVSNLGADPSGFAGGAQLGYNWQTGQFVFGGEVDLQASGAEDTFAAFKFSNPWFGTLRGRAGLAMSNVLLYATAGLAFGSGELQVAGLSESQTNFGWTAGAGIEVGFTPNWSVRAEYLYVDLQDDTYALTGLSHGMQSSLLRFGINYRF
jgi:outer membrane immunogenic protein